MTEINKKLRSSLLPAPMLIKNYVAGDGNCNYEKYLLEIVNVSEIFKLLSEGKEYTAPDNESHGENDANSEEYSLDFKLVESSSYLEAYRQYSAGVEVLVPGVKMTCESRKRGSVPVTKLHCALRDIKTFAEIENILNSESKYIPMDARTTDNIDEQIPVDVKTFFKVLHKNKNLLLFIPEEFSFDGEGYGLSEAIEIIKDALSVDYLLCLEYRKTKIAKVRGITLMTGDGPLRKAAEQEGVAIIGTIGVLDRLYEGKYIEKEEYVNCLKALIENNGQKVRLPEKELLKRVKALTMTYNLNRFITMQQNEYKIALAEIKAGQKQSHWMWYIFPQIAGLGHSPTAKMYEIENLFEAKEYMDNEYLRGNLIEITRAVLECENDDIEDIMGYPDNLKLCSCMTLFEMVAPSVEEFGQVIDRFFGGIRDKRTIALVTRPKTIGYLALKYYEAKDYRDYGHIATINGVLEDFSKKAQFVAEPDWYIKGASLYFTYENEYYVIWPGDIDATPGVFDRISNDLIDALYEAGAYDMFYAGMMD